MLRELIRIVTITSDGYFMTSLLAVFRFSVRSVSSFAPSRNMIAPDKYSMARWSQLGPGRHFCWNWNFPAGNCRWSALAKFRNYREDDSQTREKQTMVLRNCVFIDQGSESYWTHTLRVNFVYGNITRGVQFVMQRQRHVTGTPVQAEPHQNVQRLCASGVRVFLVLISVCVERSSNWTSKSSQRTKHRKDVYVLVSGEWVFLFQQLGTGKLTGANEAGLYTRVCIGPGLFYLSPARNTECCYPIAVIWGMFVLWYPRHSPSLWTQIRGAYVTTSMSLEFGEYLL